MRLYEARFDRLPIVDTVRALEAVIRSSRAQLTATGRLLRASRISSTKSPPPTLSLTRSPVEGITHIQLRCCTTMSARLHAPLLHFLFLLRPHVCSAFWQGKNIPDSQHSHKWTVYLRGLENEDLSYFIEKVSFTLHHSFAEPVRGASRFRAFTAQRPVAAATKFQSGLH